MTALFLSLMLAAPPTPRETHVRASLVAEAQWARPGRPLTVGLRLQMDPEWHTYWKNPGDSGLATRIRWTLPQGFEAGPIAWPSPERFAAEPLASYGYDKDVVLLSEIRVPAAAPTGSPAVIAARVDWLECRDVCRPGKADLSLTLDVKGQDPSADPRWAALFAETRARLPREKAPWSLAGSPAGGTLTVVASGKGAAPRDAYFFPGRAEVVDHGAPQRLTAQSGGFSLALPLAANARLSETLQGVLVADGVGYEVQLSVRPSIAKGETR